jgi:hypothetical protein
MTRPPGYMLTAESFDRFLSCTLHRPCLEGGISEMLSMTRANLSKHLLAFERRNSERRNFLGKLVRSCPLLSSLHPVHVAASK